MKERLKKLRRELDLTQTEFAERIGSVQNTITGYESGRRNPSNPVIASICKEFNVNEKWLRTGNGEMFAPDTGEEIEQLTKKYHLSRGMQIFIEKLVKTRPETQEALINLITEISAGIESIKEMDTDPTGSDFPRTTIEQLTDVSTEELEKAYKKSRSDSVSKTTLPVSSITNEKQKNA